jgi:hypothetical protein
LLIKLNEKIKRINKILLYCISTRNDYETKKFIKFNILNHLATLFENRKKKIRKLCCMIISNFISNSDQIKDVIDNNLFPKIIKNLNEDDGEKIEAVAAISKTILNGTDDQIGYLIKLGIIESLVKLTDYENDFFEPKILSVSSVAFKCLKIILINGEKVFGDKLMNMKLLLKKMVILIKLWNLI